MTEFVKLCVWPSSSLPAAMASPVLQEWQSHWRLACIQSGSPCCTPLDLLNGFATDDGNGVPCNTGVLQESSH